MIEKNIRKPYNRVITGVGAAAALLIAIFAGCPAAVSCSAAVVITLFSACIWGVTVLAREMDVIIKTEQMAGRRGDL